MSRLDERKNKCNECIKKLKRENIMSKKDFRYWSLKNHPDKVKVENKEKANILYPEISNCNDIIYGNDSEECNFEDRETREDREDREDREYREYRETREDREDRETRHARHARQARYSELNRKNRETGLVPFKNIAYRQVGFFPRFLYSNINPNKATHYEQISTRVIIKDGNKQSIERKITKNKDGSYLTVTTKSKEPINQF